MNKYMASALYITKGVVSFSFHQTLH